MNDYRLYFLTACGKHVHRFKLIGANGDVAAIEAARQYQGRYPIEPWHRDRKVEAFATSS